MSFYITKCNFLSSTNYMFSRADLPIYDIVVTMTGLDMTRMKGGRRIKATSGYAYVGGACVRNVYLKKISSVALVEDSGGYSGVRLTLLLNHCLTCLFTRLLSPLMRLDIYLVQFMTETSPPRISEVPEPSPAPGQLDTSCPTSATPPEASNGQIVPSNRLNIFSRPAQVSVCTTLHQGIMTTHSLETTNFQEHQYLWMINVVKIKAPELVIMIKEFVPNYFVIPRIILVVMPIDLRWKGPTVERARCVSMENV